MKQNQNGSSIIVILIILVVLGVVGFVGFRIFQGQDKQDQNNQAAANNGNKQSSSGPITWTYDQQAQSWKPSSTPPACKDPFTFEVSPVDVSKATSVLYPGQTRGGHYKAHGGFGFDNNTDNKVNVIMPFDAYLVSGSRYYEAGELQYILDFVSDCGIAIRFDHLATLSDKLTELTNKHLPEPKPDDSRGTNIQPPVLIKSGEIIATAIGFSKKLNVGMDFGVYDYRQPNQASKNPAFQQAHGQFSAQTYHGVCWFDMLPAGDAATVKALPSRDQSMGKASDYCK